MFVSELMKPDVSGVVSYNTLADAVVAETTPRVTEVQERLTIVDAASGLSIPVG